MGCTGSGIGAGVSIGVSEGSGVVFAGCITSLCTLFMKPELSESFPESLLLLELPASESFLAAILAIGLVAV